MAQTEISLNLAFQEWVLLRLSEARAHQDPEQEEAVLSFAGKVRELINHCLSQSHGVSPGSACLTEFQHQILDLPEVDHLPGGREELKKTLLQFRYQILGILSPSLFANPPGTHPGKSPAGTLKAAGATTFDSESGHP